MDDLLRQPAVGKAKITTPMVNEAISRKFCAPEWATFFEVQDSTGARNTRSADAIAMNLYPSRGLRMHGMEVKVSRADWLNEMRNPDKADAILRFCDHWWIVTLPGIVKADELPPTWGLYVLKGSGLHCEVKAPQLDRQPWTPNFMAAMLRRGHEDQERRIRAGVAKATEEMPAKIEATVRERLHRELEIRRSTLGRATEALDKLKELAGLEPGGDGRWGGYFDAPEFARAFNLVRKLGVANVYSGLKSTAAQAMRFAESFAMFDIKDGE